eukprot:Em0016g783a
MLVLWVYAAQPQLTEQVPERVFNFDESQFLLAKKKGTVLGPVNCKSFLQVSCKENDKEGLTVLTGYSANGSLAPPKTVYSYKQSIPYDVLKLAVDQITDETVKNSFKRSGLFLFDPCSVSKINFSARRHLTMIAQGTTVFKLFASEDESLLVWWNAFLVLDLGLHIVDGVTWFNLQGDGPSKDESLLVWWNAFLVLDLGLHVVAMVSLGSTSKVMVLPVRVFTKICIL